MSKYLGIYIIGVITLVLGGCAMIRAYSNQEEAKEYMLLKLEEKYGEKFIVMGEEKYKNYGPLYGDVYICEIALENDTKKKAKARVTQSGEMTDDWAVYLFNEEVESEVRNTLIETEGIEVKSISLEAPATARKWEKNDGTETYLKESGAYIKIVATCEEGLSNSEYAEIIEEFLKPIYQLSVNTEIGIKAGRTYIFFDNIYVLGEEAMKPYSKEKIEKIVEERIKSSPFNY